MRKIVLSEKDLPKHWYNIQADMPKLPPLLLNPKTQKPISPDDLKVIFLMTLIEQEVSTERWIPIPEEVLNIYSSFKPTPLFRASGLEKALNTPAKIYFKHEQFGPAEVIRQTHQYLRHITTNKKE